MTKRRLGIYEIRVDYNLVLRRATYIKNARKIYDMLIKQYPDHHVELICRNGNCIHGIASNHNC